PRPGRRRPAPSPRWRRWSRPGRSPTATAPCSSPSRRWRRRSAAPGSDRAPAYCQLSTLAPTLPATRQNKQEARMNGTRETFGRRAAIARASRVVFGAALGLAVGAALSAGGGGAAMALAPKPDPLPQPVTITIGVGKAAHLSPFGEIGGRLKEMNV